MAAFFAVVLAQVKAYFAANAISAGLKAIPFVAWLTVAIVQWMTGSVLGHIQTIALVLTTVVLTLDLAGKIPAITLPVVPVKPAPVVPVVPVVPPAPKA